VADEGAKVWVLNGAGSAGQAARIAAYLDYLGLTVSAPATRPSQPAGSGTRIVVYNGAEDQLPATVKLLQDVFNTTVIPVTDPTVTADVIMTVGRNTPELTPPPAP
jgi:hypothetical protein